MYLLDTNVISELRKGNKACAGVVAWATRVVAFDMYLSVIAIMEIQLGILAVQRRDTTKAHILNTWLTQQILSTFSGRILDITLPIALQCATLHVPNPRADRDALIAATALVHGMTLITRNVKDFQNMGVMLFNPWDMD